MKRLTLLVKLALFAALGSASARSEAPLKIEKHPERPADVLTQKNGLLLRSFRVRGGVPDFRGVPSRTPLKERLLAEGIIFTP
ncbi:MAG: hypothetical protein AAF226_10140, partial [Verrucomicrobiota bacterium]